MDLALQIITIVLAVIGLIAAPLAVYLRKKGKDDAADLVGAIGGGVDTAKQMLTREQAQAMTHVIKTRAQERGVLGLLDTLLSTAGRNTKTRDELIDSTPE